MLFGGVGSARCARYQLCYSGLLCSDTLSWCQKGLTNPQRSLHWQYKSLEYQWIHTGTTPHLHVSICVDDSNASARSNGICSSCFSVAWSMCMACIHRYTGLLRPELCKGTADSLCACLFGIFSCSSPKMYAELLVAVKHSQL